jgi:replicative DNA helicase
MDNKKQKLLLEYLISSVDTFAVCQAIVQPEYFDPEFRNTAKFIKDYYSKYNALPDPAQIDAETNQVLTIQEIKADKIQYVSSEIERFCRNRAMEKAILASVSLSNDEDYGAIEQLMKDALLISLNRDLGLRYFDDPLSRLEKMAKDNPTIPTQWSEIDDLLFGGISRKELLIVSALPAGGKSITLANLGFNFIEQGLDVLYISLELSEEVIAQRYDAMFTGIGRKIWKQHISEIALRIDTAKNGKGHLDIKQMTTGTTALQIRAFLKEYHLFNGKMPDLLIIDYLDLMHPNEKIDLSDVWLKDKLCSEQLRDIGVNYNLATASASQLNRSAVNATHQDYSQISGGITKINTCDVYWSIIFNDTMKAKGEISFAIQKTRNSEGAGNTVHLKWDSKYMRIVDREINPDKLRFIAKGTKSQTLKDSLLSGVPTGTGLEGLLTSSR